MKAAALELSTDSIVLIGDRSEAGSGRIVQHCYAANGEITRTIQLAGITQIERAVATARAAFPAWRDLDPNVRRDKLLRFAALVRDRAPSLAAVTTLDAGITAEMALASALSVADQFTYYAGWADKLRGELIPAWPGPALDYSLLEPYGVVGVLVPWNGPILALGTILSPILAAGNCVVAKPSDLTPYSAVHFGNLLLEAGIPPGVVNMVPGGAEVGQAIVRHAGIDKVHMTGSTATARLVMAAA